MKYENYKIESLIFMKGTDEWTIDEKREFLETCPENADLPRLINEMRNLLTAIDDEVVKTNTYGEINKNSLKSYATKNNTMILYGSPWRRYSYSDSKDFYVCFDGSYSTFSRRYQVESIIEKLTDDKYIESRFNTLARAYAEKEDKWSKSVESDRYKATHSEQIKANRRLDAVLGQFNVLVPTAIEKRDTAFDGERFECKTAGLRLYSSHNEYGEIMVNKAPLTQDQAENLTKMFMEMSTKIANIMNEYREDIDRVWKGV